MSDQYPEEKPSSTLLRALIWAGVGLAPVAAIIVMVTGSTGAMRFAVLLVAVCVILLGAAMLIRNDPVLLSMDVEERVAAEVEALRNDLRGEIGSAARATGHRVQVLEDQVEQLRSAPPAPVVPPAPMPGGAPAAGGRVVAAGAARPVSSRAGSASVPMSPAAGHVPGPIGSASVSGPIRSASVSAPVGSASVPGPARPAGVPGPVGSASVSSPMGSASVPSPMGSASVSSPMGSASVSSPMGSASVSSPMGSASVSSPMGAASVPAPAGQWDAGAGEWNADGEQWEADAGQWAADGYDQAERGWSGQNDADPGWAAQHDADPGWAAQHDADPGWAAQHNADQGWEQRSDPNTSDGMGWPVAESAPAEGNYWEAVDGTEWAATNEPDWDRSQSWNSGNRTGSIGSASVPAPPGRSTPRGAAQVGAARVPTPEAGTYGSPVPRQRGAASVPPPVPAAPPQPRRRHAAPDDTGTDLGRYGDGGLPARTEYVSGGSYYGSPTGYGYDRDDDDAVPARGGHRNW
ncbi:hypothetical protein [Actinoplanes sp. N902-109]|uniref:hypothetical protein n=1 Tax=Actinoplanes sp. (strain N902-109) TaxID=649831 RepID=UPI0005A174A4|nr:hypothetical protein [Actinoplanes sp. N902-109]